MKGFLQKDMELLIQNKSLPVIVLVMTVFMICAQNESFVVSYLGMMGGFLAMSTISYDEADRGLGYLMTLPPARKTYAIEKYVLGYGVSAVLLAFGILVWVVTDMFRGIHLEVNELMMNCEAGVLVVAVLMIVLVPVQLKFGMDNGRIIMVAVFMGIFSVVYLAVQVAEKSGIDMEQVLLDIQSLGVPVLIVVFLVFLGVATYISCRISIRIMERKEF